MRIALVSEGTYPFEMGGVSVWCDQLLRGMPDYEWEVVALTVDGTEKARWEFPPNLVGVRNMPLWGPNPPLAKREPGPAFTTPFRAFVVALLTPMVTDPEQLAADREQFVDALHELYDAAAHEDIGVALTSPTALGILVEQWNALYGDGLSLGDALAVMRLLEHMLRPLFEEPVEADIVHASMNGLSMLVAMASKWAYGTPVLLSEHGIYLRERYLFFLGEGAPHAVKVLVLSFFRLLASASYLIADALAPHSAYNRRWQLQGGASPHNMWTMYNGVSPDSFPPVETEPEVPTVVYMGRIDPIKDLRTLITSFATVHAAMPQAVLRLFGGTPAESIAYRDGCVELVKELGLTECVRFEGQVDSPVNAYHKASIVVLSSISEGFPYTVVEAMACARTVVCTDVGGVKEAVGNAGFVVPPRNTDAMAAAILRLLEDEPLRLRLAARARQRILNNFTLEHSLASYQRVYEDLLRPVATGPGELILPSYELVRWDVALPDAADSEAEAEAEAEMEGSTP